MDFDTSITAIYCVCDDVLSMLGHCDDPQCKMSLAEIITTTITAAFFHYGNLSRARVFVQVAGYIPNMLSLSRLCKRWRKVPQEVWQWILFVLARHLRSLTPSTKTFVIDSFPIPVCQPYRSRRCRLFHGKEYLGYCASKKLNYYGLKGHLLVDENGFVMDYTFTPASVNDCRAFSWMNLELPKGCKILADKAYSSYLVEDLLTQCESIELLPLRRKNLHRQHSFEMNQRIQSSRRIVETSISAIQSLFPKAINARSPLGFELKITMFVIAKSFRDVFRQLADA